MGKMDNEGPAKTHHNETL